MAWFCNRVGLVLVSLLCWLALAPDTFAAGRLALIIGNSGYQNAEILPNAANDANDIADKLESLGFEVQRGIDLGFGEFDDMVSDFRAKVRATQADDVVFYYAGHGFQLDGLNHLVPVDARLKTSRNLPYETLQLNRIINSIHVGKSQKTIILLDACRNSPLPAKLRGEDASDGLAQLQEGDGTYIVFATQPGNVTRDGRGRNSPFATALLRHIGEPGMSISDLMIAVRKEVKRDTNGAQSPWEQGSLNDNFYFQPPEFTLVEGPAAKAPDPDAAPLETPLPAPQSKDNEVTIFVDEEDQAPLPAVKTAEAGGGQDILTGTIKEETPADAADAGDTVLNGTEVESSEVAGKDDTAPIASGLASGTVMAGVEAAPEAGDVGLVAPEEPVEGVVPGEVPLDDTPAEAAQAAALAPLQPSGTDTSVERSLSGQLGPDSVVNSSGDSPQSVAPAPLSGDAVQRPDERAGPTIAGEEIGGSGESAEEAEQALPEAPPQEQEVALLTEDPVTPDTSSDSEADLAEQLQLELARVGCFAGTADGNWERSSEKAMSAYLEKRQSALSAEPSLPLLAALQSETETVCEPSASALNQEAQPSEAAAPPRAGKRAGGNPRKEKTTVRPARPQKAGSSSKAQRNAKPATPQRTVSPSNSRKNDAPSRPKKTVAPANPRKNDVPPKPKKTVTVSKPKDPPDDAPIPLKKKVKMRGVSR